MSAAAYGQIYGFSAHNLANKISAAYFVYPHLSTVRIYASTHLRIYISDAIIYAAHTHTSTAVSDAVNTTILESSTEPTQRTTTTSTREEERNTQLSQKFT